MFRQLLLVAAAAALAATPAPIAHAQAAADSAATRPAARPADVESVDAIIAALYDVISGPAGQARDWDRFRSLFADGARLIPIARTREGGTVPRMLTPDDYVRLGGPSLERDGFFEREIARRTERFGNLVHVFSTYDARRTLADAEPFMRGINSIQLAHDGTRYWVVTVMWDSERPDTPIPARYLETESR